MTHTYARKGSPHSYSASSVLNVHVCVVIHSLVGAAAEVSVAEAREEVSGDGRQQRSEFDVQPRSDHVILVHTDASR